MKILATFLFCFIFYSVSLGQPGMWTWMSGSPNGSNCNPSQNEPKCVYAAAQWTDTTGNFWINILSALWKYDPLINNWTAVLPECNLNIQAPKGVFSPLNCPGLHINGVFTWTTPDNDLWMYGGIGEGDNCSMLWKYSITLNQWAWMGTFTPKHYGIKGVADSANRPGCRHESNAAWVDSFGNLWLFGGDSEGNDMWKYDVNNGLWTWMSGSNNNNSGNYGSIGVPSVNYFPSSRWTNFYWKDDDGNFWVGLGHQYEATDIWKFNPISLEWTWMSGSPNAIICTPYGALCQASGDYQMGARFENRTTWKISDKLILTYSGQSCNLTLYNDLWGYLPLENRWIKLGDYSLSGHYGSIGNSSPSDYPPCRTGAAGFKDKFNNIWVFGGRSLSGYWYNDLWKYEIDWGCLPSNVTGINDLTLENTVSVFPNPFHSTTTFELKNDFEYAQLNIYNTLGQRVKQQKIITPTTIVNRDGLTNSLYFYQIIRSNGKLVTGRLIIE